MEGVRRRAAVRGYRTIRFQVCDVTSDFTKRYRCAKVFLQAKELIVLSIIFETWNFYLSHAVSRYPKRGSSLPDTPGYMALCTRFTFFSFFGRNSTIFFNFTWILESYVYLLIQIYFVYFYSGLVFY